VTDYILAIDQGTSGTKAAVFDHDARLVGVAYGEITQYRPRPGWVEHDASEIWDVTLKTVAEAFRNARITAEDIVAVGVANQSQTTVFWDRETGEPACRAISWQDQRTVPICEELKARDRAGIQSRTGMNIVANCAAPKIRWVMDNDRVIQRGLAKGRLVCGTIDTWLVWKLSGGAAHVTDLSNACVTLLLNTRTLSYDEWMLNELAIPREILPELRSSSEIYAHTSPEAFFGVRLPIAGDAADQRAAVLGQACFQPATLKSTCGTGCSPILNTGARRLALVDGVSSAVLWGISGTVTWGLQGWTNVAGAAIQWLRDGLGIIKESSEADWLAGQVPDTRGLYFVPAFAGLGAPHMDPFARGALLGISADTARQHVARAALEAIAYQVRDFFEIMQRWAGQQPSVLRADGGGAKSDFLMQFQADILGIPIERPEVMQTGALGAAYLAGLATGYWQSLEELASLWRLERRFEPKMPAGRREELYRGWQEAVGRIAGCLKE